MQRYIYQFEECLRLFPEAYAKEANCKGAGNKCCNKVAMAVSLLYHPKYAAHDCYQEYFLKRKIPVFLFLSSYQIVCCQCSCLFCVGSASSTSSSHLTIHIFKCHMWPNKTNQPLPLEQNPTNSAKPNQSNAVCFFLFVCLQTFTRVTSLWDGKQVNPGNEQIHMYICSRPFLRALMKACAM